MTNYLLFGHYTYVVTNMVFYRNVWITLLFSLAFIYGDPVRTGTGGRVETIGRDLFDSFGELYLTNTKLERTNDLSNINLSNLLLAIKPI